MGGGIYLRLWSLFLPSCIHAFLRTFFPARSFALSLSHLLIDKRDVGTSYVAASSSSASGLTNDADRLRRAEEYRQRKMSELASKKGAGASSEDAAAKKAAFLKEVFPLSHLPPPLCRGILVSAHSQVLASRKSGGAMHDVGRKSCGHVKCARLLAGGGGSPARGKNGGGTEGCRQEC